MTDVIDERTASTAPHPDESDDDIVVVPDNPAGPRPRRWPRRLLIGMNIFVALCLVAGLALFGYVRYRLSQLKTAKCPSCATASGPSAGGLTPMNILLIGSNTRTGLDPGEASQFGSASEVPGARSDVTMVLHLDPVRGTASLLSIPRDLFVPLPAHSMSGKVGKIDAALNDGPDNLIAAITNDLGIPINHYIEVNFDGFRRTIDAIGGIKMDFPAQLRDRFSGLNITSLGCRKLNGATALAVVRARHLEYLDSSGRWAPDPLSDLARIRRDHTFLRIFVTTATAQVTNPLRLNSLLGGLLNQVTVDSGTSPHLLLNLFRRFRHLDPNQVPETTLPITVVPAYHYGGGAFGDVDMPVEPLDHQVIAAWGGSPVAPPNPSSTTVQIVNISGRSRNAASVAAGLAGAGFHVAMGQSAPSPSGTTETIVDYHPGSVSQAVGVLEQLSGAVLVAPDPTLPDGTVSVRVGSVVAVSPPAPPSAPSAATPSTSVPAPTTSVPTALRQKPSSAQDQAQPYDPVPCP